MTDRIDDEAERLARSEFETCAIHGQDWRDNVGLGCDGCSGAIRERRLLFEGSLRAERERAHDSSVRDSFEWAQAYTSALQSYAHAFPDREFEAGPPHQRFAMLLTKLQRTVNAATKLSDELGTFLLEEHGYWTPDRSRVSSLSLLRAVVRAREKFLETRGPK